VVENELQAHDPLRHIAVQILQFSLSFDSERLGVKRVLVRALEDEKRPEVRKACEEYAARHGLTRRVMDHRQLLFEVAVLTLVTVLSVNNQLVAQVGNKTVSTTFTKMMSAVEVKLPGRLMLLPALSLTVLVG